MRFQKKWMESCDEAEKIIVGKCAFKAYSVTNSVCYVLEIVLVICALAFGTGFTGTRCMYNMAGKYICIL